MRWIVLSIVVALAGCSGIEPGKTYPSEAFNVSVTYQEAYRRAQSHGHECLSTFVTSGDLYTDNQTGIVRVSIPKFMYTGRESLKVNVSATGESSAKVVATVDNVGVFDQRQLEAIRKTIESGSPNCR
ncbi:BPTD_2524 family lipoprotein [Neopusillimonas aestuarii]|uniref:BPTD_2524 family lipoprotein n=1 Tax=Neopusillimonas aestuarii TaxID=2716226 RepID=UPI00351B5CB5